MIPRVRNIKNKICDPVRFQHRCRLLSDVFDMVRRVEIHENRCGSLRSTCEHQEIRVLKKRVGNGRIVHQMITIDTVGRSLARERSRCSLDGPCRNSENRWKHRRADFYGIRSTCAPQSRPEFGVLDWIRGRICIQNIFIGRLLLGPIEIGALLESA